MTPARAWPARKDARSDYRRIDGRDQEMLELQLPWKDQ